MRPKKKPKVFKDKHGEYIKEWYFVRGKQKCRKICVVDGIPARKFYEMNADLISLWQDGEYELLHQRMQEEEQQNDFGEQAQNQEVDAAI